MMPLLDFQFSDEDIRQLELQSNLTFDSESSRILKSLTSIDVQACPGSGKTTLIAAKLLLLSQKWPYKYKGICVLSHTNVAKNEIIEKIKNSHLPEARSLLSYPHFIGTIQEFVNKHMGIPYLRSIGIEINLIDTDRCVELIYSRLMPNTKNYIDNKNLHGNVLFDFNLKINEGSIKINIPTFPNGSESNSYRNLKKTRTKLICEGYLFYRDLYVFAEKLLIITPSLTDYIQRRYPLTIIDEMQDTQKFQDDILQRVFQANPSLSSVQRFGDPDQAIFNGINDEVPNESYNGKPRSEMNYVIDKSHRFDTSIGNKIKNLSFNQIDLSSNHSDYDLEKRNQFNSEAEAFKHSIIIFNDDTIGHVITKFATLVAKQFSQEKKNDPDFTVKAVGAVGKELDSSNANELKIGHYWMAYNKEKSKRMFNGKCLIEDIYYIRDLTDGDCSGSYKFILDCILRLLRTAKITDHNEKFYNAKSLKDKLLKEKRWRRFRKVLVWFIINREDITSEKWQKACLVLGKILDFDPANENVSDYLAHQERVRVDSDTEASSNTRNLDGIKIEFSTIHGVKGETHDATLIFETKYYQHDIHTMLGYLTGDETSQPTQGRKIKFMRQLYVAMSRPKHLLCFAIHQDRITDAQKTKLTCLNWHVYDSENISQGES